VTRYEQLVVADRLQVLPTGNVRQPNAIPTTQHDLETFLSAIFITGRPPNESVNRRRQSFSCRRRTRVERSATARNIRILSVYFSQTSEDSSLPALLPFADCVVPEQ